MPRSPPTAAQARILNIMRDDRFTPVSVTEQDFSPPTHYRMIVRRHLNTPEKTVSTLQELPRLSQYDYELWVGKGTVRYLTREQLPDEVKSKLAMVMAASPKNFPRQFGDLFDSEVGAFNAFMCPHEDVKYIGWRISESYLCLVISLNILTQLQGGLANDPRGEGQGQGQESSQSS